MPQEQLPDRLRRSDNHGTNPRPVHAIDQRQELSMVELNPVRANPRPAELRLLQPFAVEAHAGAIPPDDLHPIRTLGPEDVKSPAERIGSRIAHHRQKTVRPLAEVNRMARHEHLYAGRDHAWRTARRTLIRRSGSTSAPTRTTMSATTISIVAEDGDVTSTNPSCGSGWSRLTTPVCSALRRQPNNWAGAIPASRAMAETLAPGFSVSPIRAD